MSETIDWRTFDNAAELAEAITDLTDYVRTIDATAVVYTDSDGFGASGKAVLLLRTLTDGSQVYVIDIRDA